MFSQLRQGSQVYLIHVTSAIPSVETGIVESIPNMPMLGYYPNLPAYPMDVTIRVADKSIPYKGINPNTEKAMATNPTTGEEVIVVSDREALNNALRELKQKSIDHINANPFHDQRIRAIDALMVQLNPEAAEKAQREQELTDLKGQVSDLTNLVKRLTSQLEAERTSSSSKTRKESAHDNNNPSA